jgi:hypothetical protein
MDLNLHMVLWQGTCELHNQYLSRKTTKKNIDFIDLINVLCSVRYKKPGEKWK